MGASVQTLVRRVRYVGGRKRARALRRLDGVVVRGYGVEVRYSREGDWLVEEFVLGASRPFHVIPGI